MRKLKDLDPNLTHFLCMGPWCWGIGTTIPGAVKNAKKNFRSDGGRAKWKQVILACHEDTAVDGLGRVHYPVDCEPVILEDEYDAFTG